MYHVSKEQRRSYARKKFKQVLSLLHVKTIGAQLIFIVFPLYRYGILQGSFHGNIDLEEAQKFHETIKEELQGLPYVKMQQM